MYARAHGGRPRAAPAPHLARRRVGVVLTQAELSPAGPTPCAAAEPASVASGPDWADTRQAAGEWGSPPRPRGAANEHGSARGLPGEVGIPTWYEFDTSSQLAHALRPPWPAYVPRAHAVQAVTSPLADA